MGMLKCCVTTGYGIINHKCGVTIQYMKGQSPLDLYETHMDG